MGSSIHVYLFFNRICCQFIAPRFKGAKTPWNSFSLWTCQLAPFPIYSARKNERLMLNIATTKMATTLTVATAIIIVKPLIKATLFIALCNIKLSKQGSWSWKPWIGLLRSYDANGQRTSKTFYALSFVYLMMENFFMDRTRRAGEWGYSYKETQLWIKVFCLPWEIVQEYHRLRAI